jgi:amino acid transporter
MTTAFTNGTAAAGAKAVTLNGHTFNSDYTTFVTGPMEAYVGHFFGAAMDWLIVTGSLACASALTNAGLRYWYALGREGILPRPLGRTHATHRTPHVAIFTIGAINAGLSLVFWFLNRAPLEMYGWLAVQGVIWIVLVQALTALATFFYFQHEHPDEHHWFKTIAAPWIGFLGQVYVLLLLYSNLYFLAVGTRYVNPWFEIPFVHFAKLGDLQFSPLGVIGVLVPLIGLGIAYYFKAAKPQKYEVLGRFVNQSS